MKGILQAVRCSSVKSFTMRNSSTPQTLGDSSSSSLSFDEEASIGHDNDCHGKEPEDIKRKMNSILEAFRGASVKSFTRRNTSRSSNLGDSWSSFSSVEEAPKLVFDPADNAGDEDDQERQAGRGPVRLSRSSSRRNLREGVRFKCNSTGGIRVRVRRIPLVRSESLKKTLWWSEDDMVEIRRREVALSAKLIENEYYENILLLWHESKKRRTKTKLDLTMDEVAAEDARGLERVLVMEIPDARTKAIDRLLDAQEGLRHLHPEVREKALGARYRNDSRRSKRFAKLLADADFLALGTPMRQASTAACNDIEQRSDSRIVSAMTA